MNPMRNLKSKIENGPGATRGTFSFFLSMNRIESEARSSPRVKLTLTPALSPRRGGIIARSFETANDIPGSRFHCASKLGVRNFQ
jgi:hypothetical protein